MGLSNAISGGIVMFGITYVLFTFAGLTDNIASFSDVSSEISNMENKLVKTSIDVTIVNPPGTDATFSFEIINTNLEKFWEFDKFDVIITYDNNGITYTQTMIYDSTCPPVAGQWCIKTWTNDVLDPGILNEGETISIDVEVDNNLQINRDLIVVVSTPNGIIASATTTV
ncbi:hypothetical protein [Nitrosopumilus ureiphilus]|uniref:Flagellar protein FlaF n=1 Tax=Nitrosopumilus ureiphilus TaxID=1470067 RepID=A0A7D5M557_9ARCH|nr:hypothetical protein [Nitrosopumilus ureiphilus]QLH06872.1 hypothetical protein C5F50_07135 [Nitrosopumilus ureiphilus]